MSSRRPTNIPTSELTDRDRRIVQFVARFQQVASSHIQTLLFPDTGRTPTDRALRRLVEREYLIRIERRLVGGARGGSGQFVYSLGRRGFYMYFTGRYIPARTVRPHTLAIVDCVVALRSLERGGLLTIVGMSTEPDCWTVIGGNELKPDLYIELARPSGQRLKLYLEIDMATERHKQIRAKLETYYRAWGEAVLDIFPGVIWIAVDDEREKELRWFIGEMPRADAHVLFQVTTIALLPALLGG